MLDTFPMQVLVGSVLGFLAGIGVGGGSLLMLWLTVVLGIAQPQARMVNLLFFIPTAVISCLFRKKQGVLDLGAVLPAVIAGCVCAAVFSYLSMHMPVELLQKAFGILMLATGVREIIYRPRKAK